MLVVELCHHAGHQRYFLPMFEWYVLARKIDAQGRNCAVVMHIFRHHCLQVLNAQTASNILRKQNKSSVCVFAQPHQADAMSVQSCTEYYTAKNLSACIIGLTKKKQLILR